MTDRPILFSGQMVRAILDGRKTKTRRIIKSKASNMQREGLEVIRQNPQNDWYKDHVWSMRGDGGVWCDYTHEKFMAMCPYGKLGDRLWVREEHYRFGHWEKVAGIKTKTGKQKWAFVQDSSEVLFSAPAEFRKGRHPQDPLTPSWHKRLARFMPRWASRITLEITDVRVERLQDISNNDAKAEGYPAERAKLSGTSQIDAFLWFRDLWQSINSPASWDANPWVWVIVFKRVQP